MKVEEGRPQRNVGRIFMRGHRLFKDEAAAYARFDI